MISDTALVTFVRGWDMGTYNIKRHANTLMQLAQYFPYEGRVYRGGETSNPKPPVSWTSSIEKLIFYWHYVGIPKYQIPAYEADVLLGINVTAIGRYVAGRSTGQLQMRAKRLESFGEVVSLSVPSMKRIGTLVERGRREERRVTLERASAEQLPLAFRTGGDSFYRGQYDGWIVAFVPGREQPVGRLDWNVFRDEYRVKMVEVDPEYRRRGVASALYRKLSESEGITVDDLDPTYQTPEGAAFRKAFKG